MLKRIIVVIFTSILLTSCTSNKPAPIIYNHKNSAFEVNPKTHNIDNNSDVSIISPQESKIIESHTDDENYAAPKQKPKQQKYKIIYHEVQFGETIEDIALSYDQAVEDIARINNLKLPYYLEESEIIKIKVTDNAPGVNLAKQNRSRHQFPGRNPHKFISPVKGKIITKFGQKTKHGINKGINIASSAGTKILAAAAGKVIYADYDAIFGNMVIIKLDNQNIVTAYAHLEDIIISKGKVVKQGDIVGHVGRSGKVDTPQLHFAIREGKTARDPLKFLTL